MQRGAKKKRLDLGLLLVELRSKIKLFWVLWNSVAKFSKVTLHLQKNWSSHQWNCGWNHHLNPHHGYVSKSFPTRSRRPRLICALSRGISSKPKKKTHFDSQWTSYTPCELTWPWKIHHFDGICQEICGFSTAMLVSWNVHDFVARWPVGMTIGWS